MKMKMNNNKKKGSATRSTQQDQMNLRLNMNMNIHALFVSYMILFLALVLCNGSANVSTGLFAEATAAATAADTTSRTAGSATGTDTSSDPKLSIKPNTAIATEAEIEHDRQIQLRTANVYNDQQSSHSSNINLDADADEDLDEDDGNVIVVATIDGTFYGISQKNGKIKWRSPAKPKPSTSESDSDSGPKSSTTNGQDPIHQSTATGNTNKNDTNNNVLFNPLLSTTTTRTNNKTWRTAAVPSIDGRVYLTLGNNQANINVNVNNRAAPETVTNSIKDLVERAPFMDSRGRFFVSSKRTYAVALNTDTGQVLRVVSASNDNKNQDDGAFDLKDDFNMDSQRSVWVGRVDYEVTVHDARTGEIDVQFSTSEVLSVEDMLQGNEHNNGNGSNADGHVGKGQDSRNDSGNMFGEPMLTLPGSASTSMKQATNGDLSVSETFPTLTQNADLNPPSLLSDLYDSNIFSTPGGRLAWRDPETGTIEWIANETFDSPVAYAVESSSGSSIGVHIVPDAPQPHLFSREYLEVEIGRETRLSDGYRHTDNDSSRTTNDDSDHDETVFGALGNGELFAIPLGRRSFRNGYGQAYGRNGLPRVPRLASVVGGSKKKPSSLAKLPPRMGHGDWLNQHEHMKAHAHLAENDNLGGGSSSPGTALAPILHKPQHCDPSSKNFPQCLVDVNLNDAQAYLYHQQQLLGASDSAVKLPDPYFQNYGGNTKNHYRDILTSWIPPAVALVFVVSFELGRRERARSEAAKMRQAIEENDFQASTESVTFQRALSDEDLSSRSDQPGVIHVSEEVLGYGGHGTVVYKGKLDGRFVAVKRMLKAYTASADREISLLIESDGHPNVVRYFLKEIRGDFVYLALELCDLTLQDLIVSLGKQKIKEMMIRQQDNLPPIASSGVHPALKKTLFDIASGVKHIHSLRIVHRDLKPANILLKSRRKIKQNSDSDDDPVYNAFQAERYLPKISDMGLGKQLAGQSSFGFSTFNTSLGAGLSGDQASTIAGAGPGSVGWQAPEVMAQRLTPEAASLDGSSGPESMLESSPAEISLNGRTSRSVDIFSLGCIFYCTLIPGSHPFGQWYEREANIMKNRPATDALKEVNMEAWDLVVSMLSRHSKSRPTASQICRHPFFWSPSQRLAFICEFSDRLESDIEQHNYSGNFDRLLVERNASTIVGRQWDSNIDPDLLNNVQKFRTYDTSSVRDCLRLIRNKHHHFEELPLSFKSIAPNQIALLEYFEIKFPSLLMHCYSICREHMHPGDLLTTKYSIPCKPQQLHAPSKKPLSIQSKLSAEPTIGIAVTGKEEDSPTLEIEVDTPRSQNLAKVSEVENAKKSFTTPSDRNRYTQEIICWQGSTTASELNCRGWMRSEDEWIMRTNEKIRKRDMNLTRCAEDPKFRTRLCNHWDLSEGARCPMLKKNKCVFAHGPAELRVKEGKRNRWGRLVDVNGNNANPQHSGGEDTYGAARQIEDSRKVEGKWKAKSNNTPKKKGRNKNKKVSSNTNLK